MVEPQVVMDKIREGLGEVTHLELEDLTGTKDHYRAVVVSPTFEGKSRIEQHQAVYAALGELMAGPVHALSLATYTPDKWNARES
ncbi:MAG: BolA family protein [Myxococcota bacterium]|nr:BolA family protein [Myxococcota bacterium]